ncbi:MAG: DUF748 domain-containing protein [Lautropia sp.]|nr:DUF748 domain-containing protein [Lautropia sp.]
MRADLSISSLRYLAPVIDELKIERPIVHLKRTARERFDFSDIIDRLRAAPSEPDAQPPRFALHHLELSGGEIRLDDQVLNQKHDVEDLKIGVPFISNLDYATAITVQPALSARVNDSPLSIAGTSMPFSETRETTLDVVLEDVDIATYLRLSPVPLGIVVPKGTLSSSLKVRFALEAGVNRLTVTGSAAVDDLQVDARDGPKLVQAKRISVGLDRVEPLAGRYGFGDLVVDGLDLELVRRPDGSFPLVQAFASQPGGAPGGAKQQALHWSIRKTRLRGGRVHYQDAAVTPPVALDHTDIQIDLAEIGNRQAPPTGGKLSLKQDQSNQLVWTGEIDLARSRAGGHLDASVAAVAPYLPYFAASVNGRLATGTLAARGRLEMGWAQAFTLEVTEAQASVENATLVLPDETSPALAFSRLAADGVAVSLAGRRVAIAKVELGGARVKVERNAAGMLNLQRLAGPAGAPVTPKRDSPGWALSIARIDLAGNGITWRDLSATAPVEVPVTELAGSIERIGTDLSTASKVDLKARLGGTGTVSARGDLTLAPWSMQLALQLQQFGVAAFDPYLAKLLTLSLDEGTLSTTGQLRLGDDRVAYRGRLEVDGLRSKERATSASTIRWRKLLLDGVDVDVSTSAPGPKDRIVVGAATLSEFFARVLLDEKGRFNLQDVVRNDAAAASAAPAAPSKVPAVTASKAPPAASARAGPAIRLGTVKLERGRASFTDRYVKPNYSVNLTGLNGSLSPMASDAPKPANIGLTGRVDGDAAIDISGRINPFGSSLFADVRAQAKGIDLPTLTPYAVKYAGYAIEKGTLSLDVHYKIENKRLEAQNRVVLDQLTLGEKVDSPNASSMPIQFALGLLKNSRGEIDVSLPISGSLNDPQFSIGGIIRNAIVNLLTRVITSPFSALASAFGDRSAELSFVEFRPGTAGLTEESINRLQTIAKALVERPALKLEIAGRVDPQAEHDAIQRQRLDARLKALKRRQAPGTGAAAADTLRATLDKRNPQDAQETHETQETQETPDAKNADRQQRQAQVRQEEAMAAGVTVSPDEYPALLKKLYDDTALAEKPRNALGMARRLEVGEMEKLLLGAISVDPDTARRLAARRSQAVRQWLATQGGIAEDRIFMLAPRTSPQMKGPEQSKPQCVAACAEFSLR